MSSSLILHINNEPFLDWIVTCDEKWILYDNQQCPPQWSNLEKAPKHFPKPNFHQKKKKKIMVTVWWSAASLIHYSFLNPSKTITSEVCSADRWDAPETAMFTASISQRNDPSSSPWQCLATHHTTNTSKVEWIGRQSFASSAIFTWPLTNRLSLLQASWQHFEGKMLPQPGEHRKCFPRVHWILKRGFLCCRNKQTYFSLAKNVLIVMVPI